MIRIGLIDGDKVIRAGRRMMIESQPGLQIVYEESDAEAALEKIPELLVDVLIIDHRLRGFDGVELTRKLSSIYQSRGECLPKVIITGPYQTDELSAAAAEVGASSVITQEQPLAKLLEQIKAI